MEDRAKDDAHKELEEHDEKGIGAQDQNTSANTSEGKTAPADRDAGSLEHGELGGNFTVQDEEEGK